MIERSFGLNRSTDGPGDPCVHSVQGKARQADEKIRISIALGPFVPWVPEPQNLNERKLVRGKERRKKGGSGQMITQPRFGADQRNCESIRSPFAQ